MCYVVRFIGAFMEKYFVYVSAWAIFLISDIYVFVNS